MENTVSVPWTLTVNNSIISNNHAGDAGGGIDTDGSGKVFINAGTVITGNTCVNQGAGIWLDAIQSGTTFQTANLTVTGALISGNAALNTGVNAAAASATPATAPSPSPTARSSTTSPAAIGGGFGFDDARPRAR